MQKLNTLSLSDCIFSFSPLDLSFNSATGSDVVIENTYIWDGVTIEDQCCVDTAVICDNVDVYACTSVGPGCVLSYNVSSP